MQVPCLPYIAVASVQQVAVRADVRNTAGFIRDPGAAVTAALLPFSASVKYDGKVRCWLSRTRGWTVPYQLTLITSALQTVLVDRTLRSFRRTEGRLAGLLPLALAYRRRRPRRSRSRRGGGAPR